ncbi:MAG: AAA family ATPase [Ramlibacter sp.]|nr:AAA family ATPase [Ramlibacter sp.]
MLTELRLQNFRCFEDHTIPLRACSVVVGKNNAGKSTLVDALRLVSIASSRFLTLGIRNPPNWTGRPLREVGVSPSIEGMEFNTENLFHRYGAGPSTITAKFESGAYLKIYVGAEGAIHAVLFDPTHHVAKTRSRAKEVLLDRVEIMPQVGPLERNEVVLGPDYVKRNLSSSLASKHFRNQLNLFPAQVEVFKQMAEDTWQGLQVRELGGYGGSPGKPLTLLVRNDDYIAEVATMGHGLQMWLQTMWFLARVDLDSTVILDEPDVYMHPDLQRRLIRHLRQRRRQIVVTTHSVEIMSEVDAEDILILDRANSISTFASSFAAAQQVLDSVGSAHNLQLARLWHAKRSLLVEGNDFRLLSDFFDVMYPDDADGLAIVPYMSIGGWNGFPYAVGSSMLLRNSVGDRISVYCLLDSDYHTPTQKAERLALAARSGVKLHIWRRKEIENYLLVPSVIQRAIDTRAGRRTKIPSVSEIEIELERIARSLYNDAFDAISNEFLLDNRSLGTKGANRAARDYMGERWVDLEGKLSLISGKAALSLVSKWAQDEFGVSMNPALLARTFWQSEIPKELHDVLSAVYRHQEF